MKRGYTVEEYREMLAATREILPDAAVTSDFIVGFCGETEDDFQQTVELVRQSRFKNSFIFKYSPRPQTKSRRALPGRCAGGSKRRATTSFWRCRMRSAWKTAGCSRGQIVEVLVEGAEQGQPETGRRGARLGSSRAERFATRSWSSPGKRS